MATPEKMKVVVIHGAHHALVDGKRTVHGVGDELELSKAELERLDPQFRNGLGERFASPDKAAKLKQKQEIEAELEDAEADDEDEAPEAAPTPPPPGDVLPKLKKPKKAKA